MSVNSVIRNLGLPQSILATKEWPDVNPSSLSSEDKKAYENLQTVISAYAKGEGSAEEIAKKYGFSSASEINRHFLRCISLHHDGDIWGFRALLKNRIINTLPKEYDGAVKRGAFNSLLYSYPDIRKTITRAFDNKREEVEELGYLPSFKVIHKKFLKLCKKAGIKSTQYPFNTAHKGYVSLTIFLRQYYEENLTRSAYSRNNQSQGKKSNNTGKKNRSRPIKPYQVIEIDSSVINAYFILSVPGIDGIMKKVIIERPSLVAAMCVASRAIIGYTVCFNHTPSAFDTLHAIENAINPEERIEITLPGLEYPTDGGLPAEVIPECRYMLFDRIKADNALAHRSYAFFNAMNDNVHAVLNLSKSASPDERPHIERVYGLLDAVTTDRMMSTTGRNKDDKRRDNPEEKAITYQMYLDYFLQIISVAIARYNRDHHSAIFCSPLEYIREYLDTGALIRRVPVDDRDEWTIFTETVEVTVRGNMEKGVRPYIHYQHADYRSPKLASRLDLINCKADIRIYKKDGSSIKVYQKDGQYIDEVSAIGNWGVTPHSYQIRSLLHKINQQARHSAYNNPDFLSDSLRIISKNAANSKKEASQYAAVASEIDIHADHEPGKASPNMYERDDEWIEFDEPIEHHTVVHKHGD